MADGAGWRQPGAAERLDRRLFDAWPRQTKPEQALEDHRKGQCLLGLPTIRTLRVLSDFDTTEALMRYAHANPPEPYPSQPWPARKKGKPVTLEPGAPAYDEAAKLDPEGEGSTQAEIIPGEAVEVAARVVRLTAPNPGMMTGPGTNTYILGHERFTVIDPGPANESHIERILELTGGVVDQVVVTTVEELSMVVILVVTLQDLHRHLLLHLEF